MNEWASQEGRAPFSERSRVSTIVPDPFAHPMVKVMGYVWRIGLFALLGLGAYWLLLRSHLGSKEFADRLADHARSALGAQTALISPLTWSGDRAAARQFSATGGEGALFRILAANDVSFRVPYSMYWQPEWRLDRVSIGSLQVEFRSGGLHMNLPAHDDDTIEAGMDSFSPPVLSIPGENLELDAAAPDPALAPEAKGRDKRVLDLDLRRDGLSVAPDFRSLRIGGVEAARFDAGWGTNESTRGEVGEASISARLGTDGAWMIEVPAGTLSQNWLRGMKVAGLRARVSDSVLTLENTAVQVGAAAAVLSGQIRGGDVPIFDLTLEGENFALGSFAGEPFDRLFDLQANGTLKIGGSTNLASGITIDGTLQVTSGSIRGLAIQQALAFATTRIRFREFEITGGTIEFTTGGGLLNVTSFSLASRADVMVRGTLAVENNVFSGALEIGADPALLQKLVPAVQERFFARAEDGKQWMTVPLDGGFDRLTSGLARELTEAHETAEKAP